ncbi:RNA-dependent RNA polymerase [Gammahymrhavirus longicaudata]|uniref:RNA-directed RNA polymerase L n=1 Tax=Diachasmimorpha longicaudata rhabdovirus TaxID=1585246 RepID=A0A120HAW4_9RHAB|nr:RNA-dependent RNA polymerase [Diachasmimorpha longicaudata rhabdovirus]ALU09129.1 RNA-dependent RNA polymerase [Diachasmimorpha longicaudata rhabdovirus]
MESLLNKLEYLKSDKPAATHLDSPIQDHLIKLVLGRERLDPRWPRWKKNLIKRGKALLNHVTTQYGLDPDISKAETIEGIAHHTKRLVTIGANQDIAAFQSLGQSIECGLSLYNSQSVSLNFNPVPMDKNELLSAVSQYGYAKELFQQAVILTGSNSPTIDHLLWEETELPQTWFWRSSDLIMWISPSWICILDGAQIHLGIREHILMISDLIGQRVTLSLYAKIAEVARDPTVLNVDHLHHIFDWGDRLLELYGNRGYELLAQWEQLCVGVMISGSNDKYWDGEVFLDQMMTEFNMWDGLAEENHCTLIVDYLKSLFNINPNLTTQAYGLYRIWGHPTVNAKAGIAKLKQHACKVKPLNHMMIEKIKCVFIERFSFDYRRQHGVWPKLDTSKLSPTSLLRIQIERNGPINKKDKRYSLLSWSKVTSEKTFDLLPKYNLIKLLSDKAMSLGVGELKVEVEQGSIGPAWKRSVLVKWLESEIGDPKKFLLDISENGFGPEECIVGVCPKERELKLWARMFGLLTLKKRMYVVLTESMLAEHILPYFPEITMLDSSTTLLKKMYYNTKDSARHRSRKGINMYTSMDFQKWNSNMREEETLPIFKFLDGLFGLTDCYTRTHEMFAKAQLYLADGTYLPTIINNRLVEDEYCWSGHLGGIEGLRQKGWTIFTVCIIRAGLEEQEVKFSLMGQGDNQVLRVTYPNSLSPSDIKAKHKSILQSLETIFNQIGPPIKPSESWTSSTLFIYGKFPILNGCPLSMSMKKACRMFPFSNEGYPTLESGLSSISANLTAACNSSLQPDLIYLVYAIQSIECVKTNLSYSYMTNFQSLGSTSELYFQLPREDGSVRKVDCSDSRYFMSRLLKHDKSILEVLLLYPRCLGGYPVTLMGTLFSNGFPDPVSENVCLLKKLYDSGFYQSAIFNILSPEMNDEISSELICEDPVALNLLHPSSPKEVLKRMVQDYLKGASWIKNIEFKTFIDIAIERQKPLCDLLLDLTPFNPRVAHAIQEATIVGRAIQVVGQMEKTNTLITMMQQAVNFKISKRIIACDQNYFLSVCYNLTNHSQKCWSPSMCSREWSQTLRDRGWGRHVTGVTVAPILESFIPQLRSEDTCRDHLNLDLGYFLYSPTTGSDPTVWKQNIDIGPHDPYIGSTTVEKTRSYGKDLSRSSQPVLTNASRLLSLINWGTKRDSNLSSLIIQIFQSITDLDYAQLIPIAGQIAGSLEHRFMDSSTKHGGSISILYSLATWCHLSSNTLTEYKSGSQNVNLHFQALMSSSLIWSSLLLWRNYHTVSTIHYHVNCRKCIIPICEDMLDLPHPPPSNLLKSLPHNPICWVSKDSLNFSDKTHECHAIPIDIPPDYPYNYEVFHMRLAQICSGWMRGYSLELGDNRKDSPITNSLNVSWVSKIDLIYFVDLLLCKMTSGFLYSMDYSQLNHITSRDQLITQSITSIMYRPRSLFRWVGNLYLNENVLDQFKILFGGIPLPPSVPLAYSDVSHHFIQIITHRLSVIGQNPEELISSKVHYAESSKAVDEHPVFSLIAEKLLMESDPLVFQQLIREFLNWKIIFRNIGIVMGNHLHLNKSIKEVLMYDHKSVISPPDMLRMAKHSLEYKIIWTTDHMDILAKRLASLTVPAVDHPLHLSLEHKPLIAKSIQTHSCVEGSVLRKTQFPRFLPLISETTREVHEQRIVKSPTSSWYKLLPILFQTPITDAVLCLADGSAGFSFLTARLPTVEKVYYNTIFDNSKAMDQACPNFIPSSFVGFPELRKKLISLNDLVEGISNILHVGFIKQLANTIGDNKITFLTCDAEGSSSYDTLYEIQLLEQCLKIGYIFDIPLLFIKFYGNSKEFLSGLSSVAFSYYREIKIIRSLYSNKGNREFYLLCKEVREESHFYSINFDENFVSIEGFSIPPKNSHNLFQDLVAIADNQSPNDENVNCIMAKLLMDPFSSTMSQQLISLWFGKVTPGWKFPQDFIRHQKTGVDPIRYGKRTRRPGMINLLTFQRQRGWAMAWLAGLRLLYPHLNLERVCKMSLSLWIIKLKTTWIFGVGKTADHHHPGTKVIPLQDLMSSKDLNMSYSLAGHLKSQRVHFANGLSHLQTRCEKEGYEANLVIFIPSVVV